SGNARAPEPWDPSTRGFVAPVNVPFTIGAAKPNGDLISPPQFGGGFAPWVKLDFHDGFRKGETFLEQPLSTLFDGAQGGRNARTTVPALITKWQQQGGGAVPYALESA